jgi:hypothetical protein
VASRVIAREGSIAVVEQQKLWEANVAKPSRVYGKLVRLERDGNEFPWAIESEDGRTLEGRATLGLLIAVFGRLLEMFALGAPIVPFQKRREGGASRH